MKINEAPEKIYMNWVNYPLEEMQAEYTRTDAFIEKAINFLNYKLDDIVATRVPGTIIPHHVAKQELIEDFGKYLKGE